MAKATWAGGNDLREQLMQRIKRPAVFVTAAFDNVAGVRLPVFQITTDPTVDILKNINLSAGGHVILAARDKYLAALSELTAFFTLDSEIKMTNRRVNALNNVVLPKLDRCIGYITKELDEMEREEFFRLKKIQEKKKVAKEAELQALEAAQKEARAQGKLDPTSILAEDDEDIVF
ncbi:hypothetical protein Emed_003127 [Eimeria media]